MESVTNWILTLEGFVGALSATEWVGFAVFAFALIAIWTGLRGGKPGWDGPSVRVVAVSAFATILLGISVGVSIHLPLGACLLAVGCGLSFWSLLLSFGVSWRGHIRPGMLSATLLVGACVLLILSPQVALTVFFVLAVWTTRNVRRNLHAADRLLSGLSTRALALTRYTAASYLADSWFQRIAPDTDNLLMLSVAQRARTRAFLLPRTRSMMLPSDVLRIIQALSENALDQRLRTDGSSRRVTSWVRVLARQLLSRVLERTGMIWLFNLASDLVLAVPPTEEESWADRVRRSGVQAPEVQGYVMALVEETPTIVHQQEADALRAKVSRDADAAGPDWLEAIAVHAERWREETPNENRDLRMELVGEIIWSVYESAIGPRPMEFDLYDQLRVQAPELVERSSVQDVQWKDNDETFVLRLSATPRQFHELGRGASPLILQTRDDETWCFRRLETDQTGVLLLFEREHSLARFPRLRKPRNHAAAPRRRKAATPSALATAAQ